VSTAKARVAAPRRAPATTRPARPALRVVKPGELSPRVRRRRAGAAAVVALLVVFGGLFGLAVCQAVMAQNQMRLDRLGREVADAQARYQRLRFQVAQLESPERIVAAAQERLGMVPPATVRYLSPSGAVADEVLGDGGDAPPEDAPAEQGGSGAAWAAIKPYLGGRP
jgi:cell division protein FtsL